MGRGRKSKLTPQVQEKIVKGILAGVSYEAASLSAGVPYDTFNSWLARGRGTSERRADKIYVQFAHAIEAANAEAELALVQPIATNDDWRARSWLLTHSPRFKEKYADVQKLEAQHTVQQTGSMEVTFIDYRAGLAETSTRPTEDSITSGEN